MTNDGKCTWFADIMSISYCPVNIRWFPFDKQKCWLNYELWGHDPSEANITSTEPPEADLSLCQDNGEWNIVGKYTYAHIILTLLSVV